MDASFKNSTKTNKSATDGSADRVPFKTKFYSKMHLFVAGLRKARKLTFSNPYLPKAKTYEKLISSYKKSFEYIPTVQKAFNVTYYQMQLVRIEKDAENSKALEKIYGEIKSFCTEAISKLSANGPEKLAFLHIYRGMVNYRLVGYENQRGATENEKRLCALAIEDCTSAIKINPNNVSWAYMYRAFAREALGDIEKKEGNGDAAKSHWEQADSDYGTAIRIRSESGLFKNRSDVKLKLGDKAGSEADLRVAAKIEMQERIEEQLSYRTSWFPIVG